MMVGGVEGFEPVERLLPHLVGARRKDVDVVAGALMEAAIQVALNGGFLHRYVTPA